MKRISLITATIAALALPGIAIAAETATEPRSQASPAAGKESVSNADKTFVEKAAQVNLTEIELAKAAETNATDENVKKIARDLAAQHSQAQQKLERLAASKGITLPEKLSPAQLKKIAAIREKRGEAFDKAYLKDNIQGQEQAIALFESASIRTADGEIKAWAIEMIPNLKRNLSNAKAIKPEAVGERTKEKKQRSQQPQTNAPLAPAAP